MSGPQFTHILAIVSLGALALTPGSNNLLIGSGYANTIFVNAQAQGFADGHTWGTAFSNLQDAISIAGNGDEIWVAQGTYRTRDGKDEGVDPFVTFDVPSGVQLLGGFIGTEELAAQRDPSQNVTFLSGDQLADDVGFLNASDNSVHVIRLLGCSAATLLDGFEITGGRAMQFDASYTQRGGGIQVIGGAPHISRCRVTLNRAFLSGGGIDVATSAVIISGCSIDRNLAQTGGGLALRKSTVTLEASDIGWNTDGGIVVAKDSTITMLDSSVIGNFGEVGGLEFNDDGNNGGEFDRCRFLGNSTTGAGGAIRAIGFFSVAAPNEPKKEVVVRDSEMSGNTAQKSGGAISATNQAISVTSSSLVGNTCRFGGAGIDVFVADDMSISTCIVWANIAGNLGSEEIVATGVNKAIVEYSDVDYLLAPLFSSGTGNMSSDPMFVDAAGVDGLIGTIDDDLRLSAGSPCLDKGVPGLIYGVDVAGMPRCLDGDLNGELRLDIGSHEFSNVSLDLTQSGGQDVLQVLSTVPMFGILLIGPGATHGTMTKFGQILVGDLPTVNRLALGLLPVTITLPASATPPGVQSALVSLQALGLSVDPSAGNLSNMVSVPVE